MTHDPLCPHRPAPPEEYSSIEAAVPCQCSLINKVRADTLDKARETVRQPIYDALVDDEYWCDQPCCEFSEQRESEFSKFHDRVTAAAVEAIDSLRGEP